MFFEFLLGLKEEIIDWIQINISTSWSSSKEACPLPSVVFCVEEEICANYSNADGDNGKNKKHQKHEPINVVDLVSPERCENKVHLNEDGAKGQDASHWYDHQWFHKPLLFWNWPRHRIDATGIIWSTGQVTAQYCAHQVEGQNDKNADWSHSNLKWCKIWVSKF